MAFVKISEQSSLYNDLEKKSVREILEGHEHGMCSCTYSLFRVALHQTQRLQSFCHSFAHVHVDIPPLYVRGGQRQHIIMAVLNNAVDFALSLGELPADGCSTRMVTAIIFIGFGTGIAKQKASALQRFGAWTSMHYFAVHGNDGRE